MRMLITGFAVTMLLGSAASQERLTKGSFGGVAISGFKSGQGGSLVRPTAAVFVGVHVLDVVGVRFEAAYSQRGEAVYSSSTELSYLDFSVLVNTSVMMYEPWGVDFRLFAGPQLGILVSADNRILGGSTVDSFASSSKSDFGILMGGGLAVNVGNGALFVDGRVYLGTKELTLQSFGYPMLMRSVSIVTGFEF